MPVHPQPEPCIRHLCVPDIKIFVLVQLRALQQSEYAILVCHILVVKANLHPVRRQNGWVTVEEIAQFTNTFAREDAKDAALLFVEFCGLGLVYILGQHWGGSFANGWGGASSVDRYLAGLRGRRRRGHRVRRTLRCRSG